MKLVSGIVDSGFFAQSALSAEVATKDSLGRNISETYLTGVDLTPYQTVEGMTAYQSAGDYLTTADSGNFLTAIPDTYLQNTDLTIVNDTVTEISGKPLSAVSDIFWAVYGTTTYEDTLAAYNAGKKIFVYDNGDIWPLIEKNGNPDAFRFTKILDAWSNSGPKMQYMILSVRDGWYKSNNYPLQADWNETYQYYPAYIKNKPDLTQYQTTAGMTAYQSAGDYLTTADSGNFLTAVPDTYLQNTDLSTTDGKVTAISGVPLAAGGGEVPEGVMVESGLEYNAVDEISGYNGSAFAQYGAEKQWLVTDDTLLTLSNSAQFAIGVNISAVQQLMGIDETELLDSTATSAFTLTEPLSGFNAVKIKLRWWDKVPDNYYDVERFTTGKLSLSWTYFDNVSDANPLELAGASWTSNNGINYNLEAGVAKVFSTGSTAIGNFTHTPWPLSIIGIGRKEI